ncbi:hypothetical protein [Kaistella montana]|uniref:Uncharacterized protein n=1 Tax=Kaistella montana TaxID=1849733 RepID=A0ABW5K779_9FLAO|nr:hypothetical protein [Kaistella montana]MCQ4034600.1 hypothetical protein [Kaistella montana]
MEQFIKIVYIFAPSNDKECSINYIIIIFILALTRADFDML